MQLKVAAIQATLGIIKPCPSPGNGSRDHTNQNFHTISWQGGQTN